MSISSDFLFYSATRRTTNCCATLSRSCIAHHFSVLNTMLKVKRGYVQLAMSYFWLTL